ncbi:MAG: hypothetical protein RMY28_003055 [Nostoc sp. ChiSLP01]|nr:hypothetical protein [Nostoc sp. CmiSLP01]MDZ8289624.1 hypothetical protein [Nostoc sp. ChiSLP01]
MVKKAIGQGEYLGYKFLIFCETFKDESKIYTCAITQVDKTWDECVGAVGGFNTLARMHLHVLGSIRKLVTGDDLFDLILEEINADC